MVEEPGWCLVGELERFRAAGLYDPSSPAATQREELLHYLLERFSVEEILHWLEHTNLVGVAARAIDRPPPFISADEAATMQRANRPIRDTSATRTLLRPGVAPDAAAAPPVPR